MELVVKSGLTFKGTEKGTERHVGESWSYF